MGTETIFLVVDHIPVEILYNQMLGLGVNSNL